MDAKAAKVEWFVLSAKARIDSFNQNNLREQLRRAQASGFDHIALDVHATRFISLAAIQFLVEFAKELKGAGGQFALLQPSEKSKRHFEIYGSLNPISVIRQSAEIKIRERAELGNDSNSSGSSHNSGQPTI